MLCIGLPCLNLLILWEGQSGTDRKRDPECSQKGESMFSWKKREKRNDPEDEKAVSERVEESKSESIIRQMLDNASICMQTKQYEKAADTFMQILKLEMNVEAMKWLGALYNTGLGVEKNDMAALYWCDKAADAGYLAAGKAVSGILGNYVRKYGRSGISAATDAISKACETGENGIQKDPEKAKYWKEKGVRISQSGPELSRNVTFGRFDSEETEVILRDPELDYEKIIVDRYGIIQDFPGIEKGSWTKYLESAFDFETGKIRFRTSCERKNEGGFRMLWEIQPDGRYWADEGGFGAEDDYELILFADLDDEGNFIMPFNIYSVNGKKVGGKPQEKELKALPFSWERNVNKYVEAIVDHMKKSDAENNIMAKFDIPGTGKEALLVVEPDLTKEGYLWFEVRVTWKGYDIAKVNFLKNGSSDVIREYLEEEETKDCIIHSIKAEAESF